MKNHSIFRVFFHAHSKAFSLVEMLMALLVASLLLAALAPVMTRKFNDSINVKNSSSEPVKQKYEIEYGMEECSNVYTDSDGSEYCEGEFVIPKRIIGGQIQVTVIGAGGGGGLAKAAGYTEYTNPSITNTFKVPALTNEIEATLIEGGGGGGAGSIDTEEKGYAWTHSGTLNRAYVPVSDVSSKVKNVKVSGSSIAANYGNYDVTHGNGTLSANDTKYIAGNKIFVTLSGGGGGGGRGYVGTGGGGGATYKRSPVSITRGVSYGINVATGGSGHACNGYHGCGGAASSIYSGTYSSSTVLLLAGGGGGGNWTGGYNNSTGSDGEYGGAGAMVWRDKSCQFQNYPDIYWTSGGYGANPNGGWGETILGCWSYGNPKDYGGSYGGSSVYGVGGVYSQVGAETRHGQGYGAGGCGGGGEYAVGNTYYGNGAPGFVAAEWYNFSNGASGGGGGSILPLQKVAVIPNEDLGIVIGAGGKGGKAGSITSIGNVTASESGQSGQPSYLKRGDSILLRTSLNSATTCNAGGCGGDSAGRCSYTCKPGWVFGYANGSMIWTDSTNTGAKSTNAKYPGFEVTAGNSSGNKTSGIEYSGTLTSAETGGNGGTTTTPFTGTCNAAKGSDTPGTAGANATGYGCGGGGGYGLANGGNGSSGYARISWNKYWDSVSKTYKLSETEIGAGGGGASGNIMTYSIYAREGETLKLRIGKGGEGGYVSNNEIVDAKKGGDTIFAYGSSRQIKAGGGYGGNNPSLNGSGADISNVCHYQSTSYFNNEEYCTKGTAGSNAAKKKGGAGADLPEYGTGGSVRNPGTGVTDGYNAEGHGAGGGGASLRDIGVVNNGETTSNPTKGGNGSNGKIIIEWYE